MNSLILSARITKLLNIATPHDALFGVIDAPKPELVAYFLRHIDHVCLCEGYDEVDVHLFEHEHAFKYIEVFCICCDSTLMLEVSGAEEARNLMHVFNEGTRHMAFRLAVEGDGEDGHA